jgi:hypothetical protein
VIQTYSAEYVQELEQRIKKLEGALRSISANTCCGPCQEAKLVAQAALAEQNDS